LEIDPHLITEAKVDRTLSRIYRDTRFSQDKSLYRENMWLVFMREKKLYEGLPAFYFDMGPDGFSYGMGYYRASSASMQAIRRLILDNSAGFLLADKAYRHQNVFAMEGECYKRSKYPAAREHQQEWLNKKSISFNCTSGDERLLFSDELAGTLQEGFCLLAPIYEFLCQAETQRDLAGVIHG